MRLKWGWAFPAAFFGLIVFAGFNAFFRDVSTDPGGASENLILGIVCIPLTVFFVWKLLRGSLRVLPERRKYDPGAPLPIANCPGLLMTAGEVCHICERVRIGKVKNISTGSVTTHSGGSVRVARGLSVHSGTSRSRTTRADVLDVSPGMFYVTNKRVIGSSPKYNFSKKLASLTTVTLYSDGFALQFGGENYTVFVQDPIYVATILQVAHRLNNA